MKTFFYIMMTLILLIGFGYLLLGKSENINNKNTGGVTLEGNIQKVTLGIKNYNYYPNTIKVQAGQPVRIYLDKSVVGCYRGFVIKDFGISEYLKTPNDYVEFTPTKKGTFRFSCSMGMGTGTIIVE